MEVIAHRGGGSFGAENSIGAIESSLANGADGVEIDVRLSADGMVVLMHDPDVARTTNGQGRVADMSFEDLHALGVPSLEEVLARVPGDRLVIVELKGHPWEAGHDAAEPLAHAVAAMVSLVVSGGGSRLVVSSFNPMALHVIKENAPRVTTALLTSAAFDLASNLAAVVAGSHDECHVPIDLLDSVFVSEAHTAGKRVVAWTVNDASQIRACLRSGVDGVITDDPVAARAVLREDRE